MQLHWLLITWQSSSSEGFVHSALSGCAPAMNGEFEHCGFDALPLELETYYLWKGR